jgi:hypothetical protein
MTDIVKRWRRRGEEEKIDGLNRRGWENEILFFSYGYLRVSSK